MNKKLAWLLSYLFPVNIEKSGSETNPSLEVCLYKGRYMLNTPSATYSHEEFYKSFAGAFRELDFPSRKYNNALILGLGLGSIPILLSKSGQNCKMTAIEIDPEIIRLFREYYDPASYGQVEVHCADALKWVAEQSSKFDLILIDLFFNLEVPFQFRSKKFLNDVLALLDVQGTLMFSWVLSKPRHHVLFRDYSNKIFYPRIKKADCIEIGMNRMLILDRYPGASTK